MNVRLATDRRVVLCADDFGMEPSVNDGILRLAEAGRITAVTCMVNRPAWREGAGPLRSFAGRVDAGLHLDLETRSGLEVIALAARSGLGLVDEARIQARIAAQFDRFAQVFGSLPTFVDGHQHVHQLAPVRRALLGEIDRRYGDRKPYVRNVVPSRRRGAKAAIIAGLGARALLADLRARAIPHNGDFAGVYDLSARSDYPRLMRGWLADVEDGALLMCHPGLPGPGAAASARGAELRYLESDRFAADCMATGARLVRPTDGR